MQTNMGDAAAAAAERLELCFSGPDCDWTRFYKPKDESQAMGSRYQLIYSALGHFVALERDPDQADKLRPQLDTVYRGLFDDRSWKYWYASWQKERTWPLQKGNLTYAGRLSTFIGFYIDAFGERPHRTRRPIDDLQRSLPQSLETGIGVSQLRRELFQQRDNVAV